MLGQSSVKDAFGIDVVISSEMQTALTAWSNMYINQADWLGDDVHSLNLPAEIAGEIARIATVEMKVTLSGSARADFLAAQIKPVLGRIREYLEYGNAKGGLVFKPYPKNGMLAIDVVQADMFYPIAFDSSGNMTACIFADQKTIGKNYYTRLEYHSLQNSGYSVRNLAYMSTARDVLGSQVPLSSVPDWADLQPDTLITGVTRPLFAYYRYPGANNIDTTSPLGVSCYARAVDLIKDADVQWSNFLWEFDSGKRALYTDVLAWDKDQATGKVMLPNRRLYRTLNGSGRVGDEELFKEWSPTLREANILNGLDAILKQIEFGCGLAYGTLSNPQTVDKTATEIKISRQRTYATITDVQKSLTGALDNLLYAADVWATLGNLSPRGAYAAVYEFDDSVLTDKDAQFSKDTQAHGLGAMSLVEWRMRNYGEDEATARKMIAMAAEDRVNEPMFPA